MDTFGQRLVEAMYAAAITEPEQLSRRLAERGFRVPARTVWRWMTLEEADLPAKLGFVLARCLNVGVAWLIGGYGTVAFGANEQEAVEILNRMTEAQSKEWLRLGRKIVRMAE